TNQPKPFSWNLRVQPGIDLGTYPITVEVLTGLSWDANSYPDSAVWSSVPELEATVTVAELGALAIQQPVILPADTNRALVVTNQNIVVRVPTSVDPTFDERELVLYLPDVFSSDSVSSVVPTGSGVITFPLTVPDTLPGQIQRFDVVLRARSSLDSTLVTDTDSLFMDIRRNASLTLGGRILGINGTTVSGGQAFRYGALVSNSGSSLSSNGEVTLSLGPGLNFSGGSQAVQTFIPGDSLFWNVTAASNSQAEKLAGQISELREQKRVLFSQMARGNRVDEGSGSNQQELSRLGGEIDGLYEALGKLAVPSFLNA
ncbi:MAG: hypothetical protein KDI06_22005, partial [Calditrichaeota bacterium]|nr:hypothetical protein [Calditrichota bacterium]